MRSLAIDVKHAHLYFSTYLDRVTHIERMNLDGSGRESIVRLSGPSWVSSLLIDSAANQMFWVEREMSHLMSLDLAKDGAKSRIVTEYLDSPNAITKSGEY